MLVQLNKCSVCLILICKEGIVVMGVCLRRFCFNMKVVGDICLFELSQGTTGCYQSDERTLLCCRLLTMVV